MCKYTFKLRLWIEKRVTQKPFRMAEGSLSSFAAIKLIYVEINGYPLENKEDNRCFYGKCLLYLRYETKR